MLIGFSSPIEWYMGGVHGVLNGAAESRAYSLSEGIILRVQWMGERKSGGVNQKHGRKTRIGLLNRPGTFSRTDYTPMGLFTTSVSFFPGTLRPAAAPHRRNGETCTGPRSTRNWSDARSSLKLFYCPLQIIRQELRWLPGVGHLVRYVFEKSLTPDTLEDIPRYSTPGWFCASPFTKTYSGREKWTDQQPGRETDVH